jgi:hypothetical protein
MSWNYSGDNVCATVKVCRLEFLFVGGQVSQNSLVNGRSEGKRISRSLEMNAQTRENGVAQKLERIVQEFASQREQLQEETVSFSLWEERWKRRQRSIDASLALLRSRLNARKE